MSRTTQREEPAARRAAATVLAGQIADDAIAVVELLTNLIGAGGENTCELAAMRVQVARMGMLAEQLRRAQGEGGCGGWYRDPVHWVLVAGGSTACADAWDTLGQRQTQGDGKAGKPHS